MSRAGEIELEGAGVREQQEGKLGRAPHDALEVAAARVAINARVDEGVQDGLGCRKGLGDAAAARVVLIHLVSVLLLEQRARNGLPFAEEGCLSCMCLGCQKGGPGVKSLRN